MALGGDAEAVAGREGGRGVSKCCKLDGGDYCVLDAGHGTTAHDCGIAVRLVEAGKGRNDCPFWQEVPEAADLATVQAGKALVERERDGLRAEVERLRADLIDTQRERDEHGRSLAKEVEHKQQERQRAEAAERQLAEARKAFGPVADSWYTAVQAIDAAIKHLVRRDSMGPKDYKARQRCADDAQVILLNCWVQLAPLSAVVDAMKAEAKEGGGA